MKNFVIDNFNSVVFCDERANGPGKFASVTLEANDGNESWGEFMRREEALALYGWLGLMLS